MTKYTLIGILACVAGGVLIGFQAISSVMGQKVVRASVTLVDIVGERYFEWMGSSALGGVERIVEYIVTMPLFVLLFCIGGLFFVLDYFLGRR